MNLEDFYPNYPSIEDPEIQQKILNKKEFFDLKLKKKLETIEKGEALAHQQIIKRFMNGYTLYDELLLIHQTGTGKTGVAFGVTENLYDSKSFTRVYVLARGGSLLISLMKQLVFVHSKRYTIPEDIEPDKQLRYIKRMTSDYYQFQTYETFTKSLAAFPDDILKNKYENSIFILDEVHNIKSDENASIYAQFHRLFHLLENRKILLMSATPMRDEVYELAYIMNLILPLDIQLPVEKNFDAMYVQSDDIINTETLKDIVRGRISFLNTPQDNTMYKIMGNYINDLKVEQFKIFETNMSELQQKGYSEAFLKDTMEERSIYSNSRQASLFVFPDGSYGQNGYEKFGKSLEFRAEVSNIGRLSLFSSKYSFIINNILENPKKLVYIYCSIVNGSGVNLFTQILERYGFTRAKGTEKGKGRRYIALTAQLGNIDTPLSFFNSKRNMFGDYCQVIIGSRKIAEGFTFKNIQIIHIATLHWNYTEIQQAIARGIRYRSHENLILAGYKPVVKIYQHASLVNQTNPTKDVRSIDILMMEASQRKDILIRKMDRVLKEAAFDCPLTYERNVRLGRDNSRDCDYQECEYKCESSLEPISVDLSTYNLYYQNVNDNINRILHLFAEQFSLSFQSIQDSLELDDFQLLQALSNIIRYNIPIMNKYGIESYLRESHNEYYLVDNVVLPNERSELYQYSKTPYITKDRSLKNTIQNKVFRYNSGIIKSLPNLKTIDEVKNHLEALTLELQELVLEKAVNQHLKQQTRLSSWVMSIYEPYIKSSKDYSYISLLLLPKARCLKNNRWKDCIYEKVVEDAKQTVDPEKDNPYGVYGIQQGEQFCIKEIVQRKAGEKIDKRKEKSGSNCLEVGWNKPRLAELCIKLKIDVPSNVLNPEPQEELSRTKTGKKVLIEWQNKGWSNNDIAHGLYWYKQSKEQLCTTIKNWLNQKRLLVAGQCGKFGKKK